MAIKRVHTFRTIAVLRQLSESVVQHESSGKALLEDSQ